MQVKSCRKCYEVKPRTEFYAHRSYPDGLQYWCKVCSQAANAAYRIDARASIKERKARYRRENAERLKLEDEAWRAANREYVQARYARWQREHRVERSTYNAEWRKALSPERRATLTLNTRTRRRARQKAAGPLPSAGVLAAIISNPCAYCGSKANTIDHIRPLVRGGLHTAENLVAACKPCNSSKRASWLSEWWDQGRVQYAVANNDKVAAEFDRQARESALRAGESPHESQAEA